MVMTTLGKQWLGIFFGRNGTEWVQVAKFAANDGAASDNFGSSIVISTDSVLVGANSDRDNGGKRFCVCL